MMAAVALDPTTCGLAEHLMHSVNVDAHAVAAEIRDGLIILDLSGKIISANPQACQIFNREDLRGLPLANLFAPDATPVEVALDALTQGANHHEIMGSLDVNGQRRHYQMRFSAQSFGVLLLFQDISERIQHKLEINNFKATMALSQELLRRKNEELNNSLGEKEKLYHQLEKADALKSEFLANTSHELRTPLNSIIGFLQLIEEGLCEDPQEEKQYIQNALTSAKNLLSLINDVLDIAKIEAGKMTFNVSDHDMETLLHEVYTQMSVQARQRGLKFEVELLNDDLQVRGDAQKIQQVMINLIGNAIKFTHEGHVKISAQNEPEDDTMVRITVEDTGFGIPVNMQEDVFKKFKQADGTSKRKHEGTGLGLTITKNLVEMMGGCIHLYSEGVDKGTKIWFTLPKATCQVAGGQQTGTSQNQEDITLDFVQDF